MSSAIDSLAFRRSHSSFPREQGFLSSHSTLTEALFDVGQAPGAMQTTLTLFVKKMSESANCSHAQLRGWEPWESLAGVGPSAVSSGVFTWPGDA